jgi:hypothetical protein
MQQGVQALWKTLMEYNVFPFSQEEATIECKAYLIHIEIAMAKNFWIDPRIKKSRNQGVYKP